MKLLAIETSTEACSAALSINGEISERYEIAPRRHAALILPMIDSLLSEADHTLAQMDAIAFGRGPGAFTGVRIGAGVVQGLAFSVDCPVVPISSLAAMAHGAMLEFSVDNVLAGIDARMGEVYWGIYQRSDSGVQLLDEEHVCTPDETFLPSGADVPKGSLSESGSWFGVGTAWQAYREILDDRYAAILSEYCADFFPRARDIATLGMLAFERGDAIDAEQAQPVYLRNNVAMKKTK